MRSPRIAPYQKHTSENLANQSAEAQNANPMASDAPIDDSLDDVLGKDATVPIYAVQRTICRSDFLINFLNDFGRLGGFDLIMDHCERICKSQQDKTVATIPAKFALPLMSTYCEALGKASPVFFKPFAHKFIPKILEYAKKTLLTASPDQLRHTKREFIEELIDLMHKGLMFRLGLKDKQGLDEEKNLFQLQVGKLLLCTSLF